MIKGIILAMLAAFSWGGAIVMSKASLDELNPGSLFLFQIISAAILSWAVLLAARTNFPLNKRSMLAYSTGLFEPFLAYTLTLYGLEIVPVGIASVIFSLESVFILILSVVILRVRVETPGIFSLLLCTAMTGSLMTVLPDIRGEDGSLEGYLLVIIGVLSAAFYVVISSKLVAEFTPLALLTGQLTFCVILSVISLLISGTPVLLPVNSILLVVFSGVMQYFLAFFLYLHALQWIQVHVAGVMLYFIPVIALVLSWLFLGEIISIVQATGIIMTITSVFWLNRKYGQNE
ncbi:DMT family transporter [Edwardsiella hoshinae]|nr:DMT family transporter [Edwardsiella hoshinae]QPR27594.1 DMT family transporter [Edwardsiella hoshinae]